MQLVRKDVTIRILAFNGKYLFVNADASNGQLREEKPDKNGDVFPSYSKDKCKPIKSMTLKS